MKTARTALTSIELIVIIAIVILLPSVLIATLDHARDLAKIPVCAKNLKYIGAAVYEYAQIHDGNLPNVLDYEGDEETHFYVQYREDRPEHFISGEIGVGEMISYRLSCLYKAGLIEDPRLFYCPSETNPFRMYKSYTNPAPPNTSYEWGTLPQEYNMENGSNQWVRSGYEWFPVDPNGPWHPITGGPTQMARKFERIDPNLPYCIDSIRTIDLITHRYNEVPGVNLLYTDGRVDYCGDPDVFSNGIWDTIIDFPNYTQLMGIYYERILLLAGQEP